MNALNESLFFSLNGLAGRSPFSDNLIVFFAEWLPYLMAAGGLVAFLLWRTEKRKKTRALIGALAAVAISRGVITEGIRFFYHHPRPASALERVTTLLQEQSYSFPSGHAAFFFALSAVIYKYDKRLGVVFFCFSTLMGIARVAAGVHYPLDILAGAVIGAAVGFASARLIDHIVERKRPSEDRNAPATSRIR